MPASEPKRDLLIVDDHPIITVAVKSLVETMLKGYRPHVAHSVGEALRQAARLKPSVAVVDISLPDGDGLDLVRRLKEKVPECSVLVFSMQNELQFGARAFRAGASGYLMKGDKAVEVVEAIRKIEAGGIYCSDALSGKLLRSMGNPVAGVEKFTNRELRVFRLMASGLSTKEIAEEMKISKKTVDSHYEHMKEKSGCANKTELLLEARDWLRRVERGE